MSDVMVVHERFNSDSHTVRTWKPGDGLTCSSQSQSSELCSRPVAVIETVGENNNVRTRRNNPVSTRRRVYCLRHLALRVEAMRSDRRCGSTFDSEVKRHALEELAVRHWDEMNSIISEMRDEAQARSLDILPDTLREAVLSLDVEDIAGGAT